MTTDSSSTAAARQRLFDNLRRYRTLAVAFSGGVDSALLLDVAVEALGEANVVAVTLRGANFPAWEGREAEEFAESLAVRQVVIPWDPLSCRGFVDNGPERCYHCKREILMRAKAAVSGFGADALADGANVDDDDDYRPGARAAREMGVVSPLRECGLRKRDIRELLRLRGRAAWEKPSYACLASRVPYGTPITAAALARIEQAEVYLATLGFRNIRVRDAADTARIEILPADRDRFAREDLWDAVDVALRRFGYRYVSLDLRGYRQGSLNEAL